MEKEKKVEEKVEEKNLVDEAKIQADRIEAGNAETKKLIQKQEKMAVEKTLSGNAEAGQKTEELTEEEKIKAESNKFLEGTGMSI